MTDDLTSLVKIEEPEFYNNPYPVYARMRAEDPVYFYEPLRTWVLTRHNDISSVARVPETFSNSAGIFLTDAAYGKPMADEYFAEGSELISSLDPPRHSEIRRVIAPAIAPPVIDAMEDDLRGYCRDLIGAIEPDADIEWIAQVAEILPLLAIAQLLGLPDDKIEDMARWSDELIKLGEVLSEEERAASIDVFSGMNDYIIAQFDAKRKNPGNDVISVLLHAEIDREHLKASNIVTLAAALLAGGNETTRALLGNMIWALAEYPEQRRLLVDNRATAAQAVEETLRWKGPVHGFIRKVVRDTELHGKQLRAGDYIYMVFAAANRDGSAYPDPETFSISRSGGPTSFAFGSGPHQCPGMRLARLEARVLLEELVRRFPDWELSEGSTPIESIFRNGFYKLQVKFGAAAA